MRGRSPQEAHRAATPLELFFDLVCVVAIAQAGSGLHHAIAEQHVAEGVIRYAMVFFAIWWAWMNFTWFASAYDCDDLAYRLAVFTQMTGALILTAGIPAMFAAQDFTLGVLGYVVMRLAMVAQWLRAARGDPAHGPAARRYALGIGLVQVAWVLLLLLPGSLLVATVRGSLRSRAADSRVGRAPRHDPMASPSHRRALRPDDDHRPGRVGARGHPGNRGGARLGPGAGPARAAIAGGLLIIYSLWWLYFYRPAHDLLTSLGRAIAWGYGHYVVFAAAAAVGAGLAVALDHDIGKAAISDRTAGAAVAIPVALYLGGLWLLHGRGLGSAVRVSGPVSIGLVLLTPFTPQPVMLTGVILALLLAVKLRAQAATPSS